MTPPPEPAPPDAGTGGAVPSGEQFDLDIGSVMVILGTDAPLTDRQLGRLARRVGMGLPAPAASQVTVAATSSSRSPTRSLQPLDFETVTYRETRVAEEGRGMGALFQATIEATEEAVVSALFAAETTEGRDGHVRYGLPIDEVLQIMARHGRPRK